MIAPKLVLIPLIAGMLSACVSSGEDDLQQWMANERAQTKPRVTPISEPKNSNLRRTLWRLKWIRLTV